MNPTFSYCCERARLIELANHLQQIVMNCHFVPHSHIPFGEDGSGFYSNNVKGCYPEIEKALPYMINAVESIPFDPKQCAAFTIADYGSSDGGTSMPLMAQIIGKVKEKHGLNQDIHIYYEDQPVNDFKSLFLRLQGMIEAKCESYLTKYNNVFVAACGTNFYSQCFPSNSIHLGFSATAMHWLRKRPCVLKECLQHLSSKNEKEKLIFADAAKKDWECNLLNRAKELAPGGHMVIASLSVDEKGQSLGRTDRIKRSVFESKDKHWRSMLDDGIITTNEFESATFNDYYRTEGEIIAPFNDKNSEVYRVGLRLVQSKMSINECPYNLEYTQNGKFDQESRKAHAKEFVLSTRVWSNWTYRSALSSTRPESEKDKIVDELFARYEADVAENPEDHAMDSVHCYIHFKKVY